MRWCRERNHFWWWGPLPAVRPIISGLLHDEIRNHLEVADILCCQFEAELQSCGADEEILERQSDAFLSLLAGNDTHSLGDFRCHWIHGQCGQHIVDESLTALALRFELRPLHAMSQLGNCYHRDTHLGLAMRLADLRQDLGHAFAAPLSSDDDASVEDQSHEDGFQGFRLQTICSTSAAKSGSR